MSSNKDHTPASSSTAATQSGAVIDGSATPTSTTVPGHNPDSSHATVGSVQTSIKVTAQYSSPSHSAPSNAIDLSTRTICPQSGYSVVVGLVLSVCSDTNLIAASLNGSTTATCIITSPDAQPARFAVPALTAIRPRPSTP
ncbi:hypothetical protein E2C01_066577 [Portunus trituberculatus]|uniref:Uncharacterized protein n=1 Tax=Portunus trituberculatus TaxID=210409 RepID=A0A5B7HU72_PORTR|nr:hypothetical protein [Portunus trituberculatus]